LGRGDGREDPSGKWWFRLISHIQRVMVFKIPLIIIKFLSTKLLLSSSIQLTSPQLDTFSQAISYPLALIFFITLVILYPLTFYSRLKAIFLLKSLHNQDHITRLAPLTNGVNLTEPHTKYVRLLMHMKSVITVLVIVMLRVPVLQIAVIVVM
jgi:hypothetical protein